MLNNLETGKRKTATCKLIFRPSNEKLSIFFNNANVKNIPFLNEILSVKDVKYPLGNIEIYSMGGGYSAGQQAARLAIARFLVKYDSENRIYLSKYSSKILRSDARYNWPKLPEGRKARRPRQKSYR